jgi:dihydrofolate reductase
METPAPSSKASPLLRASLAVSLDGYIADRNGDVEWLHAYFSPEIDFGAFVKTIGPTVYGRKTWDQALARGYGGGKAGENRAVVLTHRPLDKPRRAVETFTGDLRTLAADLKTDLASKEPVKDVWLMGGGDSIASFHEAGLVDRWEISVIPVLLGEGVPLFPPGRAIGLHHLRLTHSRVLSNGIAELWYEPKP